MGQRITQKNLAAVVTATNLELFCKGLGWQGGTIYQVSDELRRLGMSYALTSVDSLLSMNKNAVELILTLAKAKAQARGEK